MSAVRTTADPQNVLEILRDARGMVEKDWGTRNLDVPFSESHGAFCASVAMQIAGTSMSDADSAAAHAVVLRAAGVAYDGDVFEATYAWNDAQESSAPVLLAFDSAIAVLDEFGSIEAEHAAVTS